MGTLEPRTPVAISGPRPQGPATDEGPLSDGVAVPGRDGGTDRLSAETVLDRILALLGPGRIARAAVAWAIMLEPCDLQDGERVARELGLDHAVDHTRPGHEATVWSGTYLGVETQVRAALRSTTGSAQ